MCIICERPGLFEVEGRCSRLVSNARRVFETPMERIQVNEIVLNITYSKDCVARNVHLTSNFFPFTKTFFLDSLCILYCGSVAQRNPLF